MAEVVASNVVDTVFGDRRIATAQVNVAASGDTWVVPNMLTINAAVATKSTAAAVGLTISGRTITFLCTADTVVQVIAIGQ